jgi:hypothetical protein
MEVLKSGFGNDKAVCATVYHEAQNEYFPVRLVAIHLDWPDREPVRYEGISSPDLCNRLKELCESLRSGAQGSTPYLGRTARIYTILTQGQRKIWTVFLVKPDQKRYWTRSMALRDADAVAADIMAWRTATRTRELEEALA